eukprot:853217-Amorphochlora_amoeboformis.AAC.2
MSRACHNVTQCDSALRHDPSMVSVVKAPPPPPKDSQNSIQTISCYLLILYDHPIQIIGKIRRKGRNRARRILDTFMDHQSATLTRIVINADDMGYAPERDRGILDAGPVWGV